MGVLRIVRSLRRTAHSMTQQHGGIARLVKPAPPVVLVRTPTIGVGADSLDDDQGDAWFPEECAPDTCSTYAGEFNVAEQTAGITSPLFNNPVPVALSAFMLIRENSSRRELIIQNVGTTAIYIGLGFPPTATNYTIALNACSAANDGTGGILVNDSWIGPVFVLASAASGGAVNQTEILR
jgi:hypothetical protein